MSLIERTERILGGWLPFSAARTLRLQHVQVPNELSGACAVPIGSLLTKSGIVLVFLG